MQLKKAALILAAAPYDWAAEAEAAKAGAEALLALAAANEDLQAYALMLCLKNAQACSLEKTPKYS